MAKLKSCKRCGRIKSLKQFYKNQECTDGYEGNCKNCRIFIMKKNYKAKPDKWHKEKAAYQLAWTRKNKDKVAIAGRKSRSKVKLDVFRAYSKGKPKCKCCGENEIKFLHLDHLNGGGENHRRELGGGSALYCNLRKNGFPPGYQILCANCNFAKIFGICPHKL